MRYLTAIAAALAFMLVTSAPTIAATSTDAIELSAATKKVDCKNPKNAKNKACAKKTDLSDTLSAATKKVDCKNPKNAKNKACKKTSSLTTEISAQAKKVDCKNPKNKNNKACKKKM